MPAVADPALSQRTAFTYTACYCEENVFILVKQLLSQEPARQLYVVFLSNSAKQVPLWHQCAGHGEDGFVLWDYHVVAVEQRLPAPALVWDLDSKLHFPCSLQDYALQALGHDQVLLPPQYRRLFRVVPAAQFLARFASDRTHMLRPDGTWSAEPPMYSCIRAPDGSHMTLPQYLDMQEADAQLPASLAAIVGPFGVVVDEEQFLRLFDCSADAPGRH